MELTRDVSTFPAIRQAGKLVSVALVVVLLHQSAKFGLVLMAVCPLIIRDKMQSFSIAVQNKQAGSMETNTAGQNVAQAVKDSFYRRLLDERGGHIEQSSIPVMGGR